MENYIVRIYRRDETEPDKMAGTFESVEKETRNTFTSLDSLIDLLTPKRGDRHNPDKPDSTSSRRHLNHTNLQIKHAK